LHENSGSANPHTPHLLREEQTEFRQADFIPTAALKFWWGSPKEKYHLEDPDVDGRIILRWIFKK
jgi:hypothetical protein